MTGFNTWSMFVAFVGAVAVRVVKLGLIGGGRVRAYGVHRDPDSLKSMPMACRCR